MKQDFYDDLISILENISWPITKEQLIDYAYDNDIDDDIISLFEKLEDNDYAYNSVDDIMEHINDQENDENDYYDENDY